MEISSETGAGIVGVIAAILGAGKYYRMQKTESASASANVAESKKDETTSAAMELMQKQISELNTASIRATNDINLLRDEIAKLRAGYLPAVMMLPTIKLCEVCGPKHQETLDFVISHLQEMAPIRHTAITEAV
jgi:hypothetical protein